jgi:hypothetical protein
MGGKFSAINANHWDDYETVEFRSHGGTLEIDKIWSWMMFLANMQRHQLLIDITKFKRFKIRQVILVVLVVLDNQ